MPPTPQPSVAAPLLMANASNYDYKEIYLSSSYWSLEQKDQFQVCQIFEKF